MINILLVLDSLKYSSGVANVVMNYYKLIDKKYIHFDFMVFDEDIDFMEEIRKNDSEIFIIHKLTLNTVNKFCLDIEHFFKKNAMKYDIIHSHFCQIDCFLYKPAKKYGIKNFISHSHSSRFSSKKSKAIRNYILCKPIVLFADYYWACSEDAGQLIFGKKFISNPKSFILKNAIDCNMFQYNQDKRSEIRKYYNIEKKFVIGHVGGFREEKNHKFLLDIYNHLRHEMDNAILMLIGDGSLYNDINALVKKLKLKDEVLLLGEKNNIGEFLQAMDCFVLPSKFEGVPVSIVEAQAADLPCVVSSAITKEVQFNNVNFLSLDDDIEDWCVAIKSTKGYLRKNNTNQVKSKGYCIHDEVKKLLEQYKKIALGERHNE